MAIHSIEMMGKLATLENLSKNVTSSKKNVSLTKKEAINKICDEYKASTGVKMPKVQADFFAPEASNKETTKKLGTWVKTHKGAAALAVAGAALVATAVHFVVDKYKQAKINSMTDTIIGNKPQIDPNNIK